jgi:polyhydroxyalkanoate synthase
MAAAPTPEMAVALRIEAASRLSQMLKGIRLYQSSPHHRALPEPPVIWQCGTARLLDYGDGPPDASPVLVAPSLINSWHILDLDRECSLLRYLARNGLRPILLDWGKPGREEQTFSLTDYLEHRLIPAFDAVRLLAPDRRISLLGYCMGGTLTVALAALRQEAVARMALMGAPWDFSYMKPMRGALAALGVTGDRAALTQQINSVVSAFGAVPVTALQAVFAQLDPGLAARKFRRFAALDQGSDAARKFVLLEDWLNAGPPLSGAAAIEALIGWQLNNAPGRGEWLVCGQRILPERIEGPAMIVAARTDSITPPGATEILATKMQSAQVIRPTSGHVGMVVSRDAEAEMWTPLARFLAGGA